MKGSRHLTKNLWLIAVILTILFSCTQPKRSSLVAENYTTDQAFEILDSLGFIEYSEKRNYHLDKLNGLNARQVAGIVRAIPRKEDKAANFFIKLAAMQLADTAERNAFIRHWVTTEDHGQDLNIAVKMANKGREKYLQNVENVLLLLDKEESISVLTSIGFAYGQTGSDGGFNGKYSFNYEKADHWPGELLEICAKNILAGDPNQPEKNIAKHLKSYLEERGN